MWQEDETNKDTRYLRNYVRLTIVPKLTDDAKHALLTLHDNQVSLLTTIQAEIDIILEEALADSQNEYSRYFFITTHRLVAYEVLKSLTGATRPQLEKILVAVKTAKAHSRHQVGGGVELHFTKSTFIVVRPDIVVS
jgi:tRNA(Ile)-lysidine synthase TilS/MesJ